MNIQTDKRPAFLNKIYWTEINGYKLETLNPNQAISIYQGANFLHVASGYIPRGLFNESTMTMINDFIKAVNELIAQEEDEPNKWTS